MLESPKKFEIKTSRVMNLVPITLKNLHINFSEKKWIK